MECVILNQQKKEVIKHFDAWTISYEQEIWTRDKYFHNRIKELVLNLVPEIKSQRILELGVGPGIYYKLFVRRHHYVIGMDISKEMLKETRANLKKIHYNGSNLILADAEFLPFRTNSFDIVNCIEVLRHLPQPYKIIWNVFREMQRILSRQGFILLTVPNILFPLNIFWVIYYMIPRYIMRIFHKGIGYHYNSKGSFPHFPVLYNEPEDHMFNLFFMKKLSFRTNLKNFSMKGIFFFPACPKVFQSLFKRINSALETSCWKFLAYSFFIKMNRS